MFRFIFLYIHIKFLITNLLTDVKSGEVKFSLIKQTMETPEDPQSGTTVKEKMEKGES